MEGIRNFLNTAIQEKQKMKNILPCKEAFSDKHFFQAVVWTCEHDEHFSLENEQPDCEVHGEGIFLWWLIENIYGIPVNFEVSAKILYNILVFPNNEEEYRFPIREIWPRCSTILNYEMDRVKVTKTTSQANGRERFRVGIKVLMDDGASIFHFGEQYSELLLEIYLPNI